jgi:Carbohydrate esterase, sialic acid-specific acetylesterase
MGDFTDAKKKMLHLSKIFHFLSPVIPELVSRNWLLRALGYALHLVRQFLIMKHTSIQRRRSGASFLLSSVLGLLGLSFAAEKPVKVYILAGQSNMVGIGQVTSGSNRWTTEFTDCVASLYEGAYDPKADYDAMKPKQEMKYDSLSGVAPVEYPKGGVVVVRGKYQPKVAGIYQFDPGYDDSTYNVMEVNGVEVHRREVGGQSKHKTLKFTGAEKVPFKITYFTAATNSVGWTTRVDVPGTLHTIVHEEKQYPYLIDKDGSWVSRDDVWYKGVVTAGANKWLSIGCGAGPSQIGPELAIGHIMGNHHEEPVLILKASQGNRSLGWDFLPPGSERFEHEGKIYAGYKDVQPSWTKGEEPKGKGWYAGKQYDDCFFAAKDVLKNFDSSFPQWKGRSYEIAGFVWFQGHKDQDDLSASRYEANLVNLINSLRKEFDAPKAPFVVGTGCGNPGRVGPGLVIAEAQLAVDGSKGKYPDFKGNVKSVDLRFVSPDPAKSPKNQDFHYHQNAGAYMQIGDALGKGMVELLQGK